MLKDPLLEKAKRAVEFLRQRVGLEEQRAETAERVLARERKTTVAFLDRISHHLGVHDKNLEAIERAVVALKAERDALAGQGRKAP